jgi:hypothetical protein
MLSRSLATPNELLPRVPEVHTNYSLTITILVHELVDFLDISCSCSGRKQVAGAAEDNLKEYRDMATPHVHLLFHANA